MDAGAQGTLDPKLKETYERIMGTSVPPVKTPTPAQGMPNNNPSSPITHAPEPVSPPTPELTTLADQPQPPAPAIAPAPVAPSVTPPLQAPKMETQTIDDLPPLPPPLVPPIGQDDITQSPFFKAGNFTVPQSLTAVEGDSPVKPQKQKNKLMPFFIGGGGILFLGAYALVWAKVFGLF